MRIPKISPCNIYPNFKSQSFGVNVYKPPSISVDTFERVLKPAPYDTPFNLNREVKTSYNKLKKEMGILNPKDIELMTASIYNKLDGQVPVNEIFQAMEILTRYSKFNSLSNLESELKSRNINMISNLKQIWVDNKIDNVPICLTNVLHYFSLKNFDFKNDFMVNDLISNSKKALILDSNMINLIRKMPKDYANQIFYKPIRNGHLYPVYIKNFENGYNFLRQDLDLEDLTVDVIKKAKAMKNGLSFKENIENVLNADNLKALDELGISPIVFDYKNVYKNILSSPDMRLADNINPKIVSKKDFKNIIKQISAEDKEEAPVFQKYYIDFLNKMLNVITPKQYAEYLKSMHNRLLDYLQSQNKSLDNTYFVIPSTNKSFVAANYQYQFINNFSPQKFIYYKGFSEFSKIGGQLFKLPENSTLVVIDDCVATGNSILSEVFNYSMLSQLQSMRRKNIGMVIAPITITKTGMENIYEVTRKSQRTDLDTIIPGKILPELEEKNRKFLKKLYKYVVPVEHGRLTSVVFPYMGPDTNCSRFIPLYEKFLYTPRAQKATIDDFCM